MFTYDVTKLSSSSLYQIRLELGLTNEFSTISMQDEEILYLLDKNNNNKDATINSVLDSLISQAAGAVDKDTGQVSEAQSQLLENLKALRDDFLNSISRNTPIHMEITGIFNKDREKVMNDSEIYHDGAVMLDKGIHERIFPEGVLNYGGS